MGFDPIKVERTILQKLRQNAEGYTSVEALIQDLDASITPEKAGKCLFSFFVHFQSLICMQGTFKLSEFQHCLMLCFRLCLKNTYTLLKGIPEY